MERNGDPLELAGPGLRRGREFVGPAGFKLARGRSARHRRLASTFTDIGDLSDRRGRPQHRLHGLGGLRSRRDSRHRGLRPSTSPCLQSSRPRSASSSPDPDIGPRRPSGAARVSFAEADSAGRARDWGFLPFQHGQSLFPVFQDVHLMSGNEPASGGLDLTGRALGPGQHPARPETCSRCRSSFFLEVGVLLAQSRASSAAGIVRTHPPDHPPSGVSSGFPPFATHPRFGKHREGDKRHLPELPAPTQEPSALAILFGPHGPVFRWKGRRSRQPRRAPQPPGPGPTSVRSRPFHVKASGVLRAPRPRHRSARVGSWLPEHLHRRPLGGEPVQGRPVGPLPKRTSPPVSFAPKARRTPRSWRRRRATVPPRRGAVTSAQAPRSAYPMAVSFTPDPRPEGRAAPEAHAFSASVRKSAPATRRHCASRSGPRAGTWSRSGRKRHRSPSNPVSQPERAAVNAGRERQHRQPVEGPVFASW